jgi:imidazolonepropionase-like amidohydrolase
MNAMRVIALAVTVVLGAAVFVLFQGGESDSTSPQGAGLQAFTGARLIDGDGRVLAESGTLVVSEGMIVAAGSAAEVPVPVGSTRVDLAGRTVFPGLINAHGHVADTLGLESGPQHYTADNLTAQLRLYARYGITTVVSLGGDGDAGFALRDASSAPGLDRARLLVAGPIVASTTPDEARADVDRVAALRPDFIKIRVDDNLGTTPKMTMDVARAVIEQAASHNLKVAAHVFYLEDAKALVEAGVGLIAHSVRDLPVDQAFIDLLTSRRVCVVPTLTREVSTFVYESEPAFFKDPFFLQAADPAVLEQLREPARQTRMRESRSAQAYKVALEVATANVTRLAEAGVSLAFGTDTGPPARFQGYFEHMELEMMQGAGLAPADVLAIATGGTAACLSLTDRGRLRAGTRADFVVVTGDPLIDILEARTIESVWIGGRRLSGL